MLAIENWFVVPSENGLGCVLMQNGNVIAPAIACTRAELSNTWPRAGCGSICIALSVWDRFWNGSQEPTIFELNLRQRHWMELLNDYDCTINYHPGRANRVASALSRQGQLCAVRARSKHIIAELSNMMVKLTVRPQGGLLARLWVRPLLLDRIRQATRMRKKLET